MKLTFKANANQYYWMEGLAYWIADLAYMKEKYGPEEPELEKSRQSIEDMFNHLDKLNVPFWVQNAIIGWADDWRRYKSEYMDSGLARRGYDISRA